MIKGNIFFGFIAPFYIHFTPFCKHQQQATINRGISIKTRSAEQKSTFFLSSWYVAIIFFFIWSISLLCDGSVHRWFWIKNKCLPLFFLLSCIPKLTPNIVVNLFFVSLRLRGLFLALLSVSSSSIYWIFLFSVLFLFFFYFNTEENRPNCSFLTSVGTKCVLLAKTTIWLSPHRKAMAGSTSGHCLTAEEVIWRVANTSLLVLRGHTTDTVSSVSSILRDCFSINKSTAAHFVVMTFYLFIYKCIFDYCKRFQ